MQRVFTEFWTSLKQNADKSTRSKALRHADYILPKRTRYAQSMVFISMVDDFTRGLIGEVNRFLLNVAHAQAWIEAAQQYEESERMSLLWEYADPHLELSVGRPYSVKNHFVFAAVHLLHQSNKLTNAGWKDDLPTDDRIGFKLLDEVGSNWKCFAPFKAKVEQLNNEQFKNATRNFRHRLQHRFRSHFDFGLTPFFEREKTDAGIAYHYKVIPPLDLEKLIPELYGQQQIAIEVFQAFWELVNELCAEWDSRHAKPSFTALAPSDVKLTMASPQ